MKWKNFYGVCLFFVLVFTLVFVSVSYTQDKVSVQMTKEEAAQFKLQKISQEFQSIVTELRKANPKQYDRLDALQKEAEAIQREIQGSAQAPAPAAPAPAKKK